MVEIELYDNQKLGFHSKNICLFQPFDHFQLKIVAVNEGKAVFVIYLDFVKNV